MDTANSWVESCLLLMPPCSLLRLRHARKKALRARNRSADSQRPRLNNY